MNAALPSAAQRYTLADIATAVGLSKRGTEKRSTREAWPCEEVAVRGGRQKLFALKALPKDVQNALSRQAINAVMPVIASEIAAPIMAKAPEAMLTNNQRLERDARIGVIAAIDRMMHGGRCSKESAMTTLLVSARAGTLDEHTINMLRHARDPRGRNGDGFPSIRTLKRWLSADDLTPHRPQKDMTPPAWASDFLGYWQQPQKPSVDLAYQQFRKIWPEVSIHQCRRFLAKMGAVSREQGRMGPRELKNIKPFIRRDFALLAPNDVWTADGHTFDAEVQHPATGKPFRPEITSIIDVGTRKCVAWSVGLAESGFVVLDAVRYGVERVGIPAVFYVDNGSGYKNQMMTADGIGLMARLGTTVTHALPYNSQAKGVVERSHQSIWIRAAKLLGSYIGASMDREAKLQHFKTTRRAVENGSALPLMPWHVFLQFCEAAVNDYNQRAHRSLGGVSPDLKWADFEVKGFKAMRLPSDQMETLFRPQIARTVDRGEIRLFNNLYFSQALKEFHGDTVFAAYDIHDASRLWVYNEDGQLICTAEVDGNRRSYFAESFMEQSKDKRLDAQLKRVDAKRKTMIEERHGAPAIEAPKANEIIIGSRSIAIDSVPVMAEQAQTQQPEAHEAQPHRQPQPQQTATPRSQRPPEDNYAEWLDIDTRLNNGEPVTEHETRWHTSYQRTPQFSAMSKKKAAA